MHISSVARVVIGAMLNEVTKMKNRFRAVLLSLVLLSPALSHAAMWEFVGVIDGTQAGTGAPGLGSVVATLDTASGVFWWAVGFGGLTTAVTSAHFHTDLAIVGPPAVGAGGVVVGLGTPLGGGTPISGAYEGMTTLDVVDSFFLDRCPDRRRVFGSR